VAATAAAEAAEAEAAAERGSPVSQLIRARSAEDQAAATEPAAAEPAAMGPATVEPAAHEIIRKDAIETAAATRVQSAERGRRAKEEAKKMAKEMRHRGSRDCTGGYR